MNKDRKHEKQKIKNLLEYPGEATDVADRDKADPEIVKQATAEMNNNPRNEDGRIV